LSRADWKPWATLAGGLALAVVLVAWVQRLPAAEPADAPADRFSAERAMVVVRHLSQEIGMRPNGTPAQERAAEYLADELKKLPGVQVELQRVSGVHQYAQDQLPFPPFVYTTVNVVARIEGRSRDAVLLDAHYDTLTEGVGAGDDAMGVAAIVEATRALATGPQLDHSIVICLNGAEEVGMLGAAGFLDHRWAEDVKAYIYLDGSPRGKPLIIGAGPGNAWLLREFAAAVPRPAATVICEDILASGMLPHNGDFRPFHDAGLIGIDLAALGDFWSIHTRLDRAERIDSGTFQLMGQSLLEGARAFASSDLPGNVDRRKLVYYDMLGVAVPVYSHTVAKILALLVLGLVVAGIVLARRRGVLTLKQIFGGLGRVALLVPATLIAGLVAAALTSLVVGRPHGWFSAPWIAAFAFGGAATAAALGVLALRRRSSPQVAPAALWAGAMIFWTIWLILAALGQAGSGYLALWLAGPTAIGFIVALFKPRWRPWLWIASFVPGAVLFLEFMVQVLPFTVADIGLVPAPQPLDLLVAALVSLTVLAIAPTALAPVAGVRRLGLVAAGCGVLALVGLVVVAAINPYSHERPKRVSAAVVVKDGEPALLVASRDALPLDPLLEGVPGAVPCTRPWSPVPGLDPPFTFELPAKPPGWDAPRVEVVSADFDADRDIRTVRIRVVSGGPKLRLYIPTGALESWSLGRIPEKSLVPGRTLVVFEGATPAQRELTLGLRGQAPVEVELIDVRGPSRADEIEALQAGLPSWVNLETSEVWSVDQQI
jgi:hypothetical protein